MGTAVGTDLARAAMVETKGTGLVEMLQSVMRRFDPAGLGLAIAVLLSSWAEPYAAPGTVSVETRLDIIIGLGLPIILILVVADGLWQRWRHSARPNG